MAILFKCPMRLSDWCDEDDPTPPKVAQSNESAILELLFDDEAVGVKLKDPLAWFKEEENLPLEPVDEEEEDEEELRDEEEEDEVNDRPKTSWPLGRISFCGQTGENLLAIFVPRQWVGVTGGINRKDPTGGVA